MTIPTFTHNVLPPTYDGAMILVDTDGDQFILSRHRHRSGNFWGGSFLEGAYISPAGEDRPEKLAAMFAFVRDHAEVDEDEEALYANLHTPRPGSDTFTIDWVITYPPSDAGTPLDGMIAALFGDVRDELTPPAKG